MLDRDFEPTPVFRAGDITVYDYANELDQRYIRDVSVHHTFGYRRCEITLVAWRGDERCGALLAERSRNNPCVHRGQIELFGDDYEIVRQNAVSIKRIYSLPNKWKVHRALIAAIVSVAQSLVDFELSVVDVQTYEYHPGFIREGFHVWIPKHGPQSFYSFYPFNVSDRILTHAVKCLGFRHSSQRTEVAMAVKRIVQKRGEVKYWLAIVPDKYKDLPFRENAWAINDHNKNASRWTMLSPEDCIFFYNRSNEVIAYASVSEKAKRRERGMEAFPLWIHLYPESVTRTSFQLQDVLTRTELGALGSGGIIEVPVDKGRQLLQKAGIELMQDGMLVMPNPFLLHGTKFSENSKEIFVVQSWELRQSVLPILKDVLERAGYKVKFSGDRDGQVIFGDIWKLMNEAAVVLVDFTQKKPNVYLEYGMALVLGKPIVAITQIKEDLPSDTPQLQYLPYTMETAYLTFREQLVRKVEHTVEDLKRARNR